MWSRREDSDVIAYRIYDHVEKISTWSHIEYMITQRRYRRDRVWNIWSRREDSDVITRSLEEDSSCLSGPSTFHGQPIHTQTEGGLILSSASTRAGLLFVTLLVCLHYSTQCIALHVSNVHTPPHQSYRSCRSSIVPCGVCFGKILTTRIGTKAEDQISADEHTSCFIILGYRLGLSACWIDMLMPASCYSSLVFWYTD